MSTLTKARQFVRDRLTMPDDQRSPGDPVRQGEYVPCCKEHIPGWVCILKDGHDD